jgi:hypothetical protein
MGTDKVKSHFCSGLPDFQKSTAFWEGPRLHPFLRLRATYNDCGALMEWCCQENNWSTQRETCLSATLSDTNLLDTDLWSHLSLHNEWWASNHMSLCMAILIEDWHLSAKNFVVFVLKREHTSIKKTNHLTLLRKIIYIYWESYETVWTVLGICDVRAMSPSVTPLSKTPNTNSITASQNNMKVQLHIRQIFYQLPHIPNREKYNKLCSVCQVTLPCVGVDSLPLNMATAKWYTLINHSSAAQPRWPTCLYLILYFESLLRPMYLNVTSILILITYFLHSIWWSTITSHSVRVMVTFCFALHPPVNKQTTT